MLLFDLLAEQRIEQALAHGELNDLPGAGKPLPEEDIDLVPEELRAGYRLLRNAGYLPPEVEARKEAASLKVLLQGLDDERERSKALVRLQLLNMRMAERGHIGLDAMGPYADALLDHLNGER